MTVKLIVIMKNIFKISIVALVCSFAVSCKGWVTPEQTQIEHIGGYNTLNGKKSEQYYANLRAYKKQAENYGRPVAFGWFSNWAPAGLVRKGYLEAIPDSMDIVSIWSGNWPLTEAKIKDMRAVQQKKGTKILACSLLSHIGKGCTPESYMLKARKEAEAKGLTGGALNTALLYARWDFWGFKDHKIGSADHKKAIANFAKAFVDSMDKYGYDGFDIDWEPGIGFNDSDGTLTDSWLEGTSTVSGIHYMLKELGKYIGPVSDKGNGHKLLVVDGITNGFPKEYGKYFDYFIKQTYGVSAPHNTVTPYYGEEYGAGNKVIYCENFESYSISGGHLLEQAEHLPDGKPKGGFGAYRFDNDYNNVPDYKWMRKAIQLNQQSFQDYKKKP